MKEYKHEYYKNHPDTMKKITHCDICEIDIVTRFKRHENTTKHKFIQKIKELQQNNS